MDTNPHQTPVAIWVRVSTQEQADGESPKHHEQRARMYAKLNNWHVVRVYDLSGVSGKSVVDHPECKAMLADIAAGRVKGLIFSKLARFARNTRELLDFAEYFQTYNADLISLDEKIDTSTPAGRLFYTLIAAMAQWEREEISARVKASVKVRATMGKVVGGAAPFGYKKDGSTLVLDETEAPIRKLMFEMFLENPRFKTTANRLNDAGYRTRRGARFSHTSVKRLLTDPIAKGTRRANYTRSLGDGKKWELKDESEWIMQDVPSVVSEELWDACNAIIKEQELSNQSRPRGPKYLFSGVTYCGCGGKMYKPTKLKKYDCNVCHNKIPETDLEKIFVEQLKAFFLDQDEIASQLSQSNSKLSEKQSLLDATARELDDLAAQMDKTYQLYLTDTLNTDEFGEIYKPLSARKRELQSQIPRLQAELDVAKIDAESTLQVVEDAKQLYDFWDHLTFEEKRVVVETIVDRIEIGESSVEISLAYVPQSQAVPLRPPQRSTRTQGVNPLLPREAVQTGERTNTDSSTRPA